MSILFAGSEAENFILTGTAFTNETNDGTAFRRTTTIRAAFEYLIQGATNTNYFNYLLAGGSYTDLWATFRLYIATTSNTSGRVLFGFRNTSNGSKIAIVGSGTGGKLSIAKISNAGTVTILATQSDTYLTATIYKYDLQIISYGASSTVNLYRSDENGLSMQLIATYTGDVTTDSNTNLDQLIISSLTTSNGHYMSEIIVSTTDTRGMSLICCEPNGNGNAFNWTGSEADIDEAVRNDTDLITANADNDLAQVVLTTSRLGTPNKIRAFIIWHRSRAGASVPNVTPNLRLGGTNYYGTQVSPTPSFANYEEVFNTNPNTGVDFVLSDLTTAGVNYGLRANT